MKIWYKILKCTVTVLAMFMVILDTKTAISGVTDGIDICLKSVVPALFPFCVLSKLITSSAVGYPVRFLRALGRICGIPSGSESILILSFVGGYPFGAQCINDAYRNNIISQRDAYRMTGFCNNAGPAFIFGILGPMFEKRAVVWALMGLQVLSAVLVGILLPHKSKNKCNTYQKATITLPVAVEESVRTMGIICGWVIIFRLILAYCDRWILCLTGMTFNAVIIGLLELSNGCIFLSNIPIPGLRYMIASVILSAGGICVAMQTSTVTKQIGKTLYVPGKVLQTCISALLACGTQYLLFPKTQRYSVPVCVPILCISLVIIIITVLHRKKVWKFVKI